MKSRTRPIPIRLDEETIGRLKGVSEAMGLFNLSAVIKLSIATQLPELESGQLRFRRVGDLSLCAGGGPVKGGGR
jgi:hypothetical protein